MELKLEYFFKLSNESRQRYERYEAKVTSAGLTIDPYSISNWEEEPTTIPNVKWSDMVLYMVSTPSPYTREEIKVTG